jgi:flavin-dependent dehydrogenase
VGETIGTTLPFIGEGVGKAMESGQLAAEAISRALDSNDLSKLSRYHRQIEIEFKTLYKGYRQAEKWLARPRLNDFIIKRFGNSSCAKKILADVIAETKNPHDIFSLKGIFKSFWN